MKVKTNVKAGETKPITPPPGNPSPQPICFGVGTGGGTPGECPPPDIYGN